MHIWVYSMKCVVYSIPKNNWVILQNLWRSCTIHVSELQKQLAFINLIYFLQKALILCCCWVYISKGLQPTGSVSCSDSQQRSWLWACGSTMGSAACLLSRPFMSRRKVVSTGMAVWFTSLTLWLQAVIAICHLCVFATCPCLWACERGEGRKQEQETWQVHPSVFVIWACVCLLT